VVFLLAVGTVGAFLGGYLLEALLESKTTICRGRGFSLAAASALVEAFGLISGAVFLFLVTAAEEDISSLSVFLFYSSIGLICVTVMDGAHGAVVAGIFFPKKPRKLFALITATIALACGITCGLPYLWIMSSLPMSFRGIEYQMLVPVLITILSLGMTTGLGIGTYLMGKER